MLSCVTIIAVVFSIWELLENRFFRNADYATVHSLYITRGIVSSLLLAFWAAWYVVRQRRTAEEGLRRSNERYRNLLEFSPGAVALYDDSLTVVEWNDSAARMYGFTKGEVLGKGLPTIPPQKREEMRSFLERIAAGGTILNVETLRQDRSGAQFEVDLSLLRFRERSGQNWYLEVTVDIRERVQLREKLLEIEKLTSMGRMAAGTAHHLNTPLAAMLLRVKLMHDHRSPEALARDLGHLESGIRFCQHFVQRLMEFSRPVQATKQTETVTSLIEGVVSFLAPSILAKQASVKVSPDAFCRGRVLADRNLLEAMFYLLLSNALDAIQCGGSIMIECSKPSADWLEVMVKDDGCGIAEEDLPRVFEPFFTTKAPGQGTGLGLAIARNIAVEHGGSIHIAAAPGEGTTVTVRLPCCDSPEPAREVSS